MWTADKDHEVPFRLRNTWRRVEDESYSLSERVAGFQRQWPEARGCFEKLFRGMGFFQEEGKVE